jgi:hypothetical protein
MRIRAPSSICADDAVSLMVLTLHCHFGDRPIITSVFHESVKYIQQHKDIWFAMHEELCRWALVQKDAHSYQSRFVPAEAALDRLMPLRGLDS